MWAKRWPRLRDVKGEVAEVGIDHAHADVGVLALRRHCERKLFVGGDKQANAAQGLAQDARAT